MTIGKHPERRDEDLPLLTLMGEPSKPKKSEAPTAIPPDDNNNGAFNYPELPFKRAIVTETKEDKRQIAKLFRLDKNGKPIIEVFYFGNPNKWGDEHESPAIRDEIKYVEQLDETDENKDNYNGPILLELKNGKKYFSDGFSKEQTCYELNTDFGILEIKAQFWQ